MNMYTKLFLATILLIVVVYIYTCETHEEFVFPPNMVGSGDFHIQQPGAIADQGSPANYMEEYVDGHTPL